MAVRVVYHCVNQVLNTCMRFILQPDFTMKLIFLVFPITLSLAGKVFAQTQLPNANMEAWTTADNGTDSLIGWSSSNAIVIPPVQSLYQETNAWEGKFAANVVTAPFGFVGYSTVGVLVNGEATFSYGGGGGGANVDYESGGGTAITQKPLALTGYYRSETLTPGDQPLAKVVVTKTDQVTGKRDTVGHGQLVFPPSSSYAPFVIPIEDLQPGIDPDSILTIFYSSDPVDVAPFDVWSNLYLDSLNLVYPTTGTTDPDETAPCGLSMYPNPATSSVTFTKGCPSELAVDLYSSTGHIVCQTVLGQTDSQWTVDSSGLQAGTYLVRIKLDGVMRYQKLVILHP